MAKHTSSQAIGYARVSTEEQARHGISLDAQMERIKAYCVVAGLQLAEIISEEGVSGSKPLSIRPGGQQLVDSIPPRGHVVALKLDRLFRDASDALAQTKEWDRAGIALHLIDMGGASVNTASAMGRFFLSVMAGFAELERNLIAERTSTALQFKKAQRRVYGHVPFGFSTNSGELTASKEEQEIIRKIRAWRDQKWTLRAIADQLNSLGITPKRGGKRWYASTIKGILSNEIHA